MNDRSSSSRQQPNAMLHASKLAALATVARLGHVRGQTEDLPHIEVGDYITGKPRCRRRAPAATWLRSLETPRLTPAALVFFRTVATTVAAATNVASGHMAYTLLVQPRAGTAPGTGPRNVYAVYGEQNNAMELPPAFHVPAPFGCDIGGTNPQFWAINADSQWDSWLTIGITQGDPHNLMSSIGIDWSSWTDVSGLSVDDGAVFWMDPSDAPPFTDSPDGVVIGQITVPSAAPVSGRCVILSAQGRSSGDEEDWEERAVHFALGTGGCGPTAPTRTPPPPPPPHHKPPPPPPPPAHAAIGCGSLLARPGMTVSYRQPLPNEARPSCTPGPLCRQYAEATIGMVQCAQPYQLTRREGNEQRVLSFAEVRCQKDGQWSELTSVCELPTPVAPPAVHPSPPSPPPHPVVRPPVNPTAICDINTLTSGFTEINEVCCTRAGLVCGDGAPPTCSTACRGVVLDFVSNCNAMLETMPAGFTALDDFVDVCSAGNGNVPGGVSNALDGLKTADGPALAGGSQMQFACTYTELTGIALQCSTADASSTEAFCASRCAAQLVPYTAQCSGTMEYALTTLGLADTFTSVISQCNPATDDSHVCPIDQIASACKSLSNPGGDPETLCSTPCVRTIAVHYDACGASSDPRVVAEFSATNWEPIVSLCASLEHGSSVADSEVDAQCALIQTSMSTQLANLCCADAQCSVLPEYCPTACGDSLLPYFHSCAGHLATAEPALFQRLTHLATVCTDQHGRGGHR